ncbi:hypothetical protein HYS96_03415 [Candidatus Daviesbacteria bacterium]|nr:hypothetical protein [Candidatus Daviesbacteria bacterium]
MGEKWFGLRALGIAELDFADKSEEISIRTIPGSRVGRVIGFIASLFEEPVELERPGVGAKRSLRREEILVVEGPPLSSFAERGVVFFVPAGTQDPFSTVGEGLFYRDPELNRAPLNP